MRHLRTNQLGESLARSDITFGTKTDLNSISRRELFVCFSAPRSSTMRVLIGEMEWSLSVSVCVFPRLRFPLCFLMHAHKIRIMRAGRASIHPFGCVIASGTERPNKRHWMQIYCPRAHPKSITVGLCSCVYCVM
jgi:hypothetical protein